jgi:protein TonB
MFNAVLGKADGQRGSLGSGAVMSVAVHALAVAIALNAPRALPDAPVEEPEVTFVMHPPAPPPPPLGGGAPKTQKPASPRPAPRNAVVISREPAPEKAPDEEPAEESEGEPYDGPGGDPEGVPWGVPDGMPGGEMTGDPPPRPPPPKPPAPSSVTLNFGSGMERPVQLSGAPPAYTREARAARVEGIVLVRCVIAVDGSVRDCTILKGLPHLDKVVLDALATHRYRPLRYEGRPVNVKYVFTFRFKLE